ncbi:MAG: response regulator transcription factor [Cyclobacteriaceae bacterium]
MQSKLISDGFVSKQIAEKLHISFNTVNTHRQNMLTKTNTSNSSELVNYTRQCGII